MRRRSPPRSAAKAVLLFASLAALSLGACSKPSKGPDASFRVLSSFYPMHIMVRNIVAGVPGVEAIDLTGTQTGCLHDYALTTADMKAIEKASAFVTNGGGMESFLLEVAKAYPKLPLIDASEGIALLPGASGPNPHVFASIRLAEVQVRNIARRLGEVDPPNAPAYERNGEAYAAKLEELAARMHAALDPLPHKKIITFHEAFPYFASEFGLEIVGVVEREPGSEPSAGELADSVALVKAKGVRALFAEPQYPAASAQTIARETGAKVYVLDPGVTGPDDPGAYLAAMEKNAAVLEEALR